MALLVFVVAVILVVGAVFVINQSGLMSNNAAAGDQSAAKVFNITAANYSFAPNQITVNQGDTVKIILQDQDGSHNLTIDGYNVHGDIVSAGGSTQITFTADQKGTFQFYCSVDGHRELGMVGTLVVQ